MDVQESKNLNENITWFDKTKDQLNSLSQKFNINLNKIIEIAAYFAVGLFIGFLLRRLGKALLFGIVIVFIALVIFDHFSLVQIDWFKVREISGISPQETIGSLFNNYFEWIKVNLAIVISALLGILLGYKIG